MKAEIEWIDVNDHLPKFNIEYLVVWDLQDGEPPVCTSMDFDIEKQRFSDPRGTGESLPKDEILFWAELPKTPKVKLKKSKNEYEPVIISLSQMEGLEHGQCIHGEKFETCTVCNNK